MCILTGEMNNIPAISLFNNLLKYAEEVKDEPGASRSQLDRYCAVAIDGHPLLREMLDIQDGLVIGIQTEFTGDSTKIAANDQFKAANQVSVVETSKCEYLDITGTPLECPFDPNDVTLTDAIVFNSSAIVESRNLLPINEACGFVNVVRDFLDCQDNSTVHSMPVILQCDGGDCAGTLFLGFQKYPVAGLRRFRVICNGAVVDAVNLETFEDVKRDHLWGIAHKVVETEARAVYRILDRLDDAFNSSSTSIKLICDWTNVEQMLELPNANAMCTIVFDVSMGDVRSPAYNKFLELSDLEELANGLRTNEVTWTAVSSRSETPVDVGVAALLDSMRIGTTRPNMKAFSEMVRQKSGVDDVDQQSFTMARTRNVDFTDKLWSILKDCGSYDELVKSLNVVLDGIKSGEIKPVIFTSNHTHFAEIVLDIIHCQASSVKRLSGVPDPLRSLVEMGIEKLKQDYACILLGSNLVTRDTLNSFFAGHHNNIDEKNPSHRQQNKAGIRHANDEDWERNLIALRKLHCAVELVALCQAYVDESHTLLGNYARIALDKLISIHNVGQSHSFTFGISWKATKAILESVFPLVWQVRLTSRHNSSFVRTAYRLSVSHPLDVTLKQEQTNNSDEEPKVGPFHICVAILVNDS